MTRQNDVPAFLAHLRENGVPARSIALLQEHLSTWRELRDGSGAPLLSTLFDRTHIHIQPWLVVIDIERDEVQPIRLVGTGITDFFGADSTGMNFLLTVTPETRGTFETCHRTLRSRAVGKFHVAICSTNTGRELNVYALALPYRRKDGMPCAAWVLSPGVELRRGESGAQVRSVVEELWIDLQPPGGA